jgi:hypothetical protein
VPLYSLCCGSRVVLSDDQRPNPLNTCCFGAAPDSTDPLAQFPSEPADAPNETDRAPRSAQDDHLLLAFASETAATDASSLTDACAVTDASTVTGASSVSGAPGHRPLSALSRVVPTTVIALSCIRVATRPFLLGLRGAPRASRDAADRLRAHVVPGLARLVVRATAWAFAFCRRLRMREEPDQQLAALTGGTARVRRLRRIAATHGAARQGGHAVPSHRWTYPTSLFLSGAAAGAFLVMVVRVPAEDRVAAQVSALPTPQVVAANYIVAERPATPAPTVAPPGQSEQPVSTSTRAQQSLPPGPVNVSARTVRTRPQSFVGSISINSRPQGAVVFLNGRRVGTTPLLMPELPVGSRAVRLTMSGYNTWSQAVQVVADRRTTVSATLIEAPDTTVSATLLEASRQ